MNDIRMIELTEKEEDLLYKEKNCPKRIHINNRRIWWVPKNQYDEYHDNFSYSVCPKCYREKKDFINKLLEENIVLIPIIVNDILSFNCDASDIDETYNISLDDDWKIGIYQQDDDKLMLLNGSLNNDEINININNYPIKILVGLYKNEVEIQPFTFIISNIDGLFNKHNIYSINNDYIFTLSEISKLISFENKIKTVFEDIILTNDTSFNITWFNQIKNNTYKLNFIKNNKIDDNGNNIFYENIDYENCIIEL